MRLLKYLSYSPVDENVNKFRAMSISLTTDTKEANDIFNKLHEQYNIESIEPIIEKLNKELRKFYNGKYMYGLSYTSGKKVNDLNCNKRKAESLTMLLFEANDYLSKIKSHLETTLKGSLQSS
jgi:hypothetical protein